MGLNRSSRFVYDQGQKSMVAMGLLRPHQSLRSLD